MKRKNSMKKKTPRTFIAQQTTSKSLSKDQRPETYVFIFPMQKMRDQKRKKKKIIRNNNENERFPTRVNYALFSICSIDFLLPFLLLPHPVNPFFFPFRYFCCFVVIFYPLHVSLTHAINSYVFFRFSSFIICHWNCLFFYFLSVAVLQDVLFGAGLCVFDFSLLYFQLVSEISIFFCGFCAVLLSLLSISGFSTCRSIRYYYHRKGREVNLIFIYNSIS